MKSSRSRTYSERFDLVGEVEASSPPSSCPPPVRERSFQYDVFLSFRGAETRKGFTDHLYHALKGKGIVTFIDSEELEKGQKVEELFRYIQRSQIFVIIFSKGYADSTWCLGEIAKIVECKRLIVPVFIDVEPSDIRHQTGPFAASFRRYHGNEAMDRVEVSKWSTALTEAGKVSGYNLADADGYEARLIQRIVKRILTEVNKTPQFVAKHPVGLNSRIADLMEMLDVEAQGDAKMIGIHSLGGMGKTTLAKAVYNQISSHFDACSFISNVREKTKPSSKLVSLQKQLLYDVFKDENVQICNTDHGIGIIKKRIWSKKVLLILDDVDNESQLDVLAGSLDWFCSGSRIIITTRDKHILRAPRVKQNEVYELKELDATQALQLFSWHAFGIEEPDTKFAELSKEVASAATGLPLALEIFGSLFCDLKTDKEWKSMLEKLKDDQDKDIHERLKISFDELDEREKKVFLDIACFFIGRGRELATLMWEDCRLFPHITIKCLMRKSLVSINDCTGEFEMHDHIRDMGRKIVLAESFSDPGMHSRLWKNDDILDVLQNKRGTKNIEAIQLFYSGSADLTMEVESFAPMSQLRVLLLENMSNKTILEGEYKHIPRTLRWLAWHTNDLDSLPSTLHLENIVVLDLSRSSITQVWYPQKLAVEVLKKLKVLNLSNCENLIISPQFRSMPHLEQLDCSGCKKMSELDRCIGHLKSLSHLSLRGCHSLKALPQEIWQLASLEVLDLSGCYKIATFPSQLGDTNPLNQLLLDKLKVLNLSHCENLTTCPDFESMPHLEKLNFTSCVKMTKLHPSIGHLKSLSLLSLRGCESLKELPQEIWQLISLERLDLAFCNEIRTLPSQLGGAEPLEQLLLDKLRVLLLFKCRNLIICPDFSSMPRLEILDFRYCSKMTKLHPSIGHLKSLTYLSLWFCESLKELPQEVCQLTSLEKLELDNCNKMSALPSQLGDLKSLKKLLIGSTNMATLPKSMIQMKQLKSLFLLKCSSLKEIPGCVFSLLNLEELDARWCCSLASLPDSLGHLKRLRKLDLSWTAIKELPHCIVLLEKLEVLSVAYCNHLKFLPGSASVGSVLLNSHAMSSTRDDRRHTKRSIVWEPQMRQHFPLPQFPPSLIKLNATGCPKLEIADVTNARQLQELDLSGCERLVDVPGIEQLKCLKSLKLAGCKSLSNSLSKRVQEANFHRLGDFSISGSLSFGQSSVARSLSLSLFLLKRIRLFDVRLRFQTSFGRPRRASNPTLEIDQALEVKLGQFREMVVAARERWIATAAEHISSMSNSNRMVLAGVMLIVMLILYIVTRTLEHSLICKLIEQRPK